ncbi:MAG TPA: hypothetical protein DCE41_16900 [Cytophagales bacterium]|nr:hypothetical protein [Cytophagales bacterium]HAA22781.1 hypothetical protein [Cytophagales bacterium]HAP60906.1 hypothetical protein [Cytophagales bacterium]
MKIIQERYTFDVPPVESPHYDSSSIERLEDGYKLFKRGILNQSPKFIIDALKEMDKAESLSKKTREKRLGL